MNQTEIKSAVLKVFSETLPPTKMPSSKEVDDMTINLMDIQDPNRDNVKLVIVGELKQPTRILLESVDSSDVDFWIDKIIEKLKAK